MPRASTAQRVARLIQATAATVPRASTAQRVARLIQATAATVPRESTNRIRARVLVLTPVRVARRERPAAGDSSVPAPPATLLELRRSVAED